jgi:Uma2 family endonuclease
MSTTSRFTTRDLDLLPDDEWLRYEIIDGELHVSTAPNMPHQYASSMLAAILVAWCGESDAGVTLTTPGVIFAPDDNVIPDVVWISRERFPHVWDDGGHMKAAPDLAIEVLSPGRESERRDRELKLALYSRHGVKEYWIVDWRLRSVQVYRREQQSLRIAETLSGGDTLTSPMLPGFACQLPKLWPPPIAT